MLFRSASGLTERGRQIEQGQKAQEEMNGFGVGQHNPTTRADFPPPFNRRDPGPAGENGGLPVPGPLGLLRLPL